MESIYCCMTVVLVCVFDALIFCILKVYMLTELNTLECFFASISLTTNELTCVAFLCNVF